jgi:hypothetical protein
MVVRNGWYVWRVKIQIQNGRLVQVACHYCIVNGLDLQMHLQHPQKKQALLRLWRLLWVGGFVFNKY